MNSLFKALSSLHSQSQSPSLIPAVPTFPFPTMYPGQLEAYHAMKDFTGTVALTSHTGAGKTALFLSLCHNIPTLIIEPRKYLQKQCATYRNDFVLFGKSEYHCKHARSAAIAPCSLKVSCETTEYYQTCPTRTAKCLDSPCRIFKVGHEEYCKYPCSGCKYLQAQAEAARTLKANGTVIANFGNFWTLLKHAELVIVDEADLFFREIAHATKLVYSSSKHNEFDSIKVLMTREVEGIRKAIETSPASQKYQLQNMLYNANFLLQQHDLCFKYQKKDKMYVEISPDKVGVLKDKIFNGKRLLLVSATLGEFDVPKYSYSVWQRRGIFYAPVGKMTSRELKMKPWLMDRAAEKIVAISEIAEGLYDTEKFVTHCANLSTHAKALHILLGEDNCVLHERGNLMKTIDTFVESDKRYLLIASGEYGASFDWCKVQFILKYPYGALDEQARTLERTMGKAKFNEYYNRTARTRLIQACGRTCRGYGDFGVTVILDSKFYDDYKMNKSAYPDWFVDSFDEKLY